MEDGKFTVAEQSELGEHAPSCAGDQRLAQSGQHLADLLKELPFPPRAVLGAGVAFIMVALGGQGHCFIFVFCFFFYGAFKNVYFSI